MHFHKNLSRRNDRQNEIGHVFMRIFKNKSNEKMVALNCIELRINRTFLKEKLFDIKIKKSGNA